jgi:hypothetical protein
MSLHPMLFQFVKVLNSFSCISIVVGQSQNSRIDIGWIKTCHPIGSREICKNNWIALS